ncbi:MAG TPA: dockerin type I domain-containing protein, partial [Thermoanaerobaculaceae bacterium]|nr:dockerin type I domain-containing protein [Thermoanaerobaculaceae bacterium]HPS77963.1 dockerin type I domain-containing protein [Thermoanaerobaculaceae bacterium]
VTLTASATTGSTFSGWSGDCMGVATCVTALNQPRAVTATFRAMLRGDVNGDGNVDVSDVFFLINYLFAGGPNPVGQADVNGDNSIDVQDVFQLINHLFAGGPAPV